jgi:glutamate transport system substrate-binding protein
MTKSRRVLAVVAAAVAGILVATGCSDDKKVTSTGTTLPVPKFAPGTTMAAIQARGRIIVGTKFDQPGFGQKNPTTGQVEGFDVEIAKGIAAGIFGGSAQTVGPKVEFVEAVSKNREPFIQNGTVDIVVATYTINDTRKQVVDFAGPYFIAEQDIMVKSSDNSIKSVNDLDGKKVCTVSGSTSEKNVRAKAPRADVVLFDTYSQCADALKDGRVVAETTDNTILAGLVQQNPGAFKLVNKPFSNEPYGIGMKKGDDTFRSFLNDQLQRMYDDGEWAAAFASTLGKLGLKTPKPPALDRYSSSQPAPAPTTATAAPTTAATAPAASVAPTAPAQTLTPSQTATPLEPITTSSSTP